MNQLRSLAVTLLPYFTAMIKVGKLEGSVVIIVAPKMSQGLDAKLGKSYSSPEYLFTSIAHSK